MSSSRNPWRPNSRLWDMHNVIITPHAAASSEVSALFRHVDSQIARFEDGLPLQNVVDRLTGY